MKAETVARRIIKAQPKASDEEVRRILLTTKKSLTVKQIAKLRAAVVTEELRQQPTVVVPTPVPPITVPPITLREYRKAKIVKSQPAKKVKPSKVKKDGRRERWEKLAMALAQEGLTHYVMTYFPIENKLVVDVQEHLEVQLG